MKKLVFMFVAIAAISFASCGESTKPAAEASDSLELNDSAANDSVANDSVANDSVA